MISSPLKNEFSRAIVVVVICQMTQPGSTGSKKGSEKVMVSRATRLLLTGLVLTVLLGSHESVRATEVVHFNSAVLPPSPFKLRKAKAQGKEIEQRSGFPIWGHLNKPSGIGPFPAIVLMHGCSGLYPSDARWASAFTAQGYVTLLLDSFGPRSIFNVCRDPMGKVSPDTRSLDAHGALAYLRTLSFVDTTRIAVAGWSHGGTSAIAAVDGKGVTSQLSGQFRAAIAFYPYCLSKVGLDRPTLILLGEADEWAPLKQCQDLKTQSQDGGSLVDLVAYPEVFHAFDVLELKDGLPLEGTNGKAYWLQYNQDAHEDSVERIKLFLAEHLSSK